MIHPYLENALLHNSVGLETFEKALKETPKFQHGVLRTMQEMPKTDAPGYARMVWVMTCPGEIPMPALEAFHISRYVYSELQGNAAQNKASQFLPTTDTKLARDLVYDAEQKKVAIVASEMGCSIKIAAVSYKIIRSATLLSLAAPETRERAVYAAHPPGSDSAHFIFEIELLQKLSQIPGLVRLLAVVGIGAKAHMVLEAFDHTLMHMMRNKEAYSLRDRLQVAADVTGALHHLHMSGILHNDLSENNIVFRRRPDGAIQAALIDLSLSCYAGRPGQANNFKRPGLYNAYWYTAPELIGVKVTDTFPANEALYKVEVFALGCILWHLFDSKSQYVPWTNALDRFHATTLLEAMQKPTAFGILTERRECVNEVRDLIKFLVEKKHIEIMVETIPACRTSEELLQAAICAMLLPSPQKRCSAGDASRTFSELLEQEKKRNMASAAGAAAKASADDRKSALQGAIAFLSDLKLDNG